jgi:glutamyl-tRNA reductase
MTKKIAISVPDDVAERLAREPNVSAYITDAVRRRMGAERTRDALIALGFDITEEGTARVREQRRQLMESVPPELRARAIAVKAEIDRVRANHGAGGAQALEHIQRIFHGEPARTTP